MRLSTTVIEPSCGDRSMRSASFSSRGGRAGSAAPANEAAKSQPESSNQAFMQQKLIVSQHQLGNQPNYDL